MRIVGGKHRSRPLYTPKDDSVRPTTDLLRESVFNILQWDIKDKTFLDLFAGSGAMGLEAMSRGAVSVFNDASRDSIALIKKNLDYLKEKAEVLNMDYQRALLRLKGRQFDYVFLDPPYGKYSPSQLLKDIASSAILAQNGMVIYESKIEEPAETYDGFEIKDRRTYGKSAITFYAVKQPRIALLAGSYDPITSGHLALALQALKDFDRVIIGLLINPDKQYLFSAEERLQLINAAIADVPELSAEYYEGWTYELALKVKATAFVRGYRNPTDLAYEQDMASFNKQHSGIDTVLYKAEDGKTDISSTFVRKLLAEGQPISDYVPKGCSELIMKLYSAKNSL